MNERNVQRDLLDLRKPLQGSGLDVEKCRIRSFKTDWKDGPPPLQIHFYSLDTLVGGCTDTVKPRGCC